MITTSKRITSGRREVGAARSDVTATLNIDDPDRPTAQIAPDLKLRIDGEPTAADEEEDIGHRQGRCGARKFQGFH